jgi:hypothetical protein
MSNAKTIADGRTMLFRSTTQYENGSDNKVMGLTPPSEGVPEPAGQRSKTTRSVLSPLDAEVQRPTPMPTP